MASVNKVIVLGNLGRDPEMRYLPSGEPVTSVTIATSSRFKNKAGEAVEETEWHRVTFFGRLAEVAGQYLKKGRPAYVEGRLRTRKYVDKDGHEKYATEIVGSVLQLLGSREGGSGQTGHAGGDEADYSASNPSYAPRAAPASPAAPAPPMRAPSSFDDMDDDIPF